jgi:hypothetical protein
LSQRCVAGLRLPEGEWVRPVSALEHGELNDLHYGLGRDGEPRVLDLLRIEVEERRPLIHQPENWLISKAPWRLLRRPAPADAAAALAGAVEAGPLLFGDRSPSVAMRTVERRGGVRSLCLVKPEAVRWRTHFDTYAVTRKARVAFQLAGCEYDLPLTDPGFVARLKARESGEYSDEEIGIPEGSEYLFTISLGEPFRGVCYKLAAAVVMLPAGWEIGL